MPLTPQQISDRLEIAEAVTRYSYGLDQRIWSEWNLAFTADAIIDFSFFGLEPTSPDQLRELFSSGDATRIAGQHLLANQIIWVDRDSARSHAEFTMTTLTRSETPDIATCNQAGGWYEDQLRRTDVGWRIFHRRGFGKWHQQDTIPWTESHSLLTPVTSASSTR